MVFIQKYLVACCNFQYYKKLYVITDTNDILKWEKEATKMLCEVPPRGNSKWLNYSL